ncbi:hypothetical protein GGX14DRAFT_330832, partial [Mycena pura]
QDIDFEFNAVFDPSKWIRQGKHYKDVPLHVSQALLEHLKPPADFTAHFPGVNMPVAQFVHLSLPAQSSSLVTIKADSWFSMQKPTNLSTEALWNILWQRSIPPRDVVTQLRQQVGQHWFDGALAIRDPRYRKSEIYLPLWVLGVYKVFLDLEEKQDLWKTSLRSLQSTLQRRPNVRSEFQTPDSVVGGIGWATVTEHGSFTFPTHRFALLLQPRMLHDEFTQAMVTHIRERLNKMPELYKKHHICGSRAYVLLDQLYDKKQLLLDSNLPGTLRKIEDKVRDNPHLIVWLPILRREHEQTLRIDFKTEVIAYGDSIPDFGPPTRIIKSVQLWLKTRFRRNFVFRDARVPSGIQKDCISCIPAAMNTICAEVFGDRLWDHDERELDRLRWFKIL